MTEPAEFAAGWRLTPAARPDRPKSELKLGINLWSQGSDWPTFLEAGIRADRLGYDHLWTWDHLFPIFGDLDQPVFEAYSALAALAQATRRIRLGLFVGANTFRNPAIATKAVTTIDHISGGRAIMGLGGGWFEPEHQAFGIEFGTGWKDRLGWLGEALAAARALLDGEEVSSAAGDRYRFDQLRIEPRPVQQHLPIMIGGAGEKRTLPLVARYADMWNCFGTLEVLCHKDEVLRARCADVGRDPDTIERTVGCKIVIRESAAEAERVHDALLERNRTPPASVATDGTFWRGTPNQIADKVGQYRRAGFHTFIVEMPSPYDEETMETLIRVVKPTVEAAGVQH